MRRREAEGGLSSAPRFLAPRWAPHVGVALSLGLLIFLPLASLALAIGLVGAGALALRLGIRPDAPSRR